MPDEQWVFYPCDDKPTSQHRTLKDSEKHLIVENTDERHDGSEDEAQLAEEQKNTHEKPHLLARLAQRLTDRFIHETKGFIVTK